MDVQLQLSINTINIRFNLKVPVIIEEQEADKFEEELLSNYGQNWLDKWY